MSLHRSSAADGGGSDASDGPDERSVGTRPAQSLRPSQPRSPAFVDKTGQELRIRRAEPDDAVRLAEMYDAYTDRHRAQGLPPSTSDRTDRWLTTVLDEGVTVVAELVDDTGSRMSRLVGHCFYTPADHPEPELAVFVHPDYHDRGIGTELCRHIIALAAATGRDAIVLEVERRNSAAVHVYRKLGFETEHEGRELFMRLPLDDRPADAFREPSSANA